MTWMWHFKRQGGDTSGDKEVILQETRRWHFKICGGDTLGDKEVALKAKVRYQPSWLVAVE